ncbi:MAG: polysaccharide pyruvyl transferase family protein [Verrucomicrobia bacterium]|jgi:hypothetical protein|nr:polysaccharide pyruvyl transferase family protein [Verrucomicrobiota bacterium]OQC62931.1 MAG: Polysaccharide pyruvyl transferase [Verrucomicrobia bacterium ADurb.Bin006]MDI9380719.1 polysaccharide pyruvyl transferase family protein [Verrucomicrobiota bacterium]NMD19725.1 polysaccharide pyruvyl transferase family protein [Verrucomicrobiota bacterium]HNU99540.1 polysaccharide pyruvyl transferase family protein [Verrucomicrobiota bacterium]
MRPLRLHWSSSKPNFGDWLSPILCEALSGRPVVHSSPARCDLIAVGSILHRLPERWWARPVRVWGTGFIEERPRASSRHHYHAVRGHRTAALIDGPPPSAFGDPGLLCDLVFSRPAPGGKEHAIGLVPHYKDRDHPWVKRFVERHPETRILNVFDEPRTFLAQLVRCEFVISSSLHGLVVADAYGIPNVWMRLSGGIRGHDFKYLDYYSVFGFAEPPVLTLENDVSGVALEALAQAYQRPGLEAVKKRLLDAFPFPAGPSP